MKRIMIIAAAAAMMCGCANKTKFVIEGNTESNNTTMYLLNAADAVIDSAAIENGTFKFTGKVEEPAFCIVCDDREDPTYQVRIFLEPGNIAIVDDETVPDGKYAKGTPANDAYAGLIEASRAMIAEAMNPETTEERNAEIEQEYDKLIRETYEANRTNILGITLLAQQLAYELSGQEILDEIAAYPEELQNGEILTELKKNAEQKMRTDIGQPYMDISQPDPDGNKISLKSVVEKAGTKYVLLDFWASWCGPCMHEVPYLRKTYDAFHKKGFEIYGVSFDRDRNGWTGAIAENNMKWVNVSTLEYFDNPAAADYSVQAIPTNFLIDSDGKIIARNLRGDKLYEKMEELLGK